MSGEVLAHFSLVRQEEGVSLTVHPVMENLTVPDCVELLEAVVGASGTSEEESEDQERKPWGWGRD